MSFRQSGIPLHVKRDRKGFEKVQRAASADEPGKENVDLKNCFAVVVL